jgi:16S rRNA processing protein RimM
MYCQALDEYLYFCACMIRVGKIVATHGLAGDLLLTHNTGSKKWLKNGDALFVAVRKGSYIPHFVASIKGATIDDIIVHLEDIDMVEAAKKLVGKEVYLDQQVLEQSGVEDSPLLWVGFELIDENEGSIGVVKDVFQTSAQWIASVMHKGNEVLIPLVKPVLQKADMKAKRLLVSLPDGLLDVYA